jgi:hypothetical protein
MLFNDAHAKEWREVFIKKFTGFAKKSPVLLSYTIIEKDGDLGVLITHVNTNKKYFFKFRYDEQVKDFIADVKRVIVKNHYPRIIEEVYENFDLTPDEVADRIAKGTMKVDDAKPYEVRKVGDRVYRIDKVILYKNECILELEQSTVPTDVVGRQERRQMATSLTIFLKKYRENKFKNLEDASAFFMRNSALISYLDDKKEKENGKPATAE